MRDKISGNACFADYSNCNQSVAPVVGDVSAVSQSEADMCCNGKEHITCNGANPGACSGHVRQRASLHNNNNNEANDVTVGSTATLPVHDPDYVPTRLEVLKDPANLTTFTGALLAVFALANMWKGRYYLAMCLNVLANICDIIDGPIARSTPGRHPSFSVVGSKLDCYSDLVSHFVVPASLLMHINDLAPLSILLAMMYVCCGIFRHSLFEVTGRCDDGRCIFGVTSDYMVALYCVVMHFRPLLPHSLIAAVLQISVLVMMFLCLTFSLRSRRYSGFGLATVTAYNVLLAISCAALAFTEGSGDATISTFIDRKSVV